MLACEQHSQPEAGRPRADDGNARGATPADALGLKGLPLQPQPLERVPPQRLRMLVAAAAAAVHPCFKAHGDQSSLGSHVPLPRVGLALVLFSTREGLHALLLSLRLAAALAAVGPCTRASGCSCCCSNQVASDGTSYPAAPGGGLLHGSVG